MVIRIEDGIGGGADQASADAAIEAALTGTVIWRGDAITGVEPTATEFPSPGSDDTALVWLNNNTREVWEYDGAAWVLRATLAVASGNIWGNTTYTGGNVDVDTVPLDDQDLRHISNLASLTGNVPTDFTDAAHHKVLMFLRSVGSNGVQTLHSWSHADGGLRSWQRPLHNNGTWGDWTRIDNEGLAPHFQVYRVEGSDVTIGGEASAAGFVFHGTNPLPRAIVDGSAVLKCGHYTVMNTSSLARDVFFQNMTDVYIIDDGVATNVGGIHTHALQPGHAMTILLEQEGGLNPKAYALLHKPAPVLSELYRRLETWPGANWPGTVDLEQRDPDAYGWPVALLDNQSGGFAITQSQNVITGAADGEAMNGEVIIGKSAVANHVTTIGIAGNGSGAAAVIDLNVNTGAFVYQASGAFADYTVEDLGHAWRVSFTGAIEGSGIGADFGLRITPVKNTNGGTGHDLAATGEILIYGYSINEKPLVETDLLHFLSAAGGHTGHPVKALVTQLPADGIGNPVRVSDEEAGSFPNRSWPITIPPGQKMRVGAKIKKHASNMGDMSFRVCTAAGIGVRDFRFNPFNGSTNFNASYWAHDIQDLGDFYDLTLTYTQADGTTRDTFAIFPAIVGAATQSFVDFYELDYKVYAPSDNVVLANGAGHLNFLPADNGRDRIVQGGFDGVNIDCALFNSDAQFTFAFMNTGQEIIVANCAAGFLHGVGGIGTGGTFPVPPGKYTVSYDSTSNFIVITPSVPISGASDNAATVDATGGLHVEIGYKRLSTISGADTHDFDDVPRDTLSYVHGIAPGATLLNAPQGVIDSLTASSQLIVRYNASNQNLAGMIELLHSPTQMSDENQVYIRRLTGPLNMWGPWTRLATSAQAGSAQAGSAQAGDVQFPSSPVALTGTTDNLALPTPGEVLELTSASNEEVTGIAAGYNGQQVIVINTGSDDIKLKDDDGGSFAANRFRFSGDFKMKPGVAVRLIYAASLSRWLKFE